MAQKTRSGILSSSSEHPDRSLSERTVGGRKIIAGGGLFVFKKVLVDNPIINIRKEKTMENKKKGMSTLAKLGIGCGGLIVLIIIIAVVAGSGSSNKSSSNSSNPTKQSETKKDYVVGETINLKNHQLVINSVDKNFQSSNMFDKPQSSDNDFVAVDVTITNTGSKDLLVNSFGFKLEDETGTQRMTSLIAGLGDQLQSVTISPNGKTTGKLGFEAKSDSKTLKLHYNPGVLGGSEVTVNL